MSAENYISLNRDSWNQRTEHHIKSEFYDVKGFLKGKSSLNDIELNLLGDVKDKSILHLQCHFGQDSLSLVRMGAKVTGVDLSDKAIDAARNFNTQLNLDATFICCDIYDLPDHLNEKFDIVYTSYGTIGWLPDLNKWAQVISGFLKPGGNFVFVEFHPVVWMFDDDFKTVAYNYSKSDPIIEETSGTYAATEAPIKTKTVGWNHGLAEVLSALLNNNLNLVAFKEYDYSPYSCFRHTKEIAPQKFRIQHLDNKIPLVYGLAASKPLNK